MENSEWVLDLHKRSTNVEEICFSVEGYAVEKCTGGVFL